MLEGSAAVATDLFENLLSLARMQDISDKADLIPLQNTFDQACKVQMEMELEHVGVTTDSTFAW